MSDLRSREVRVDNDGVAMTVRREMRLRHASDTASDAGVVFGGDQMGHWNVDRINRILDSLEAPVLPLTLAPHVMRAMAAVGAPDRERVGRYAALGRQTMPPLSFVAFLAEDERGPKVQTMLVDGHHRMLALAIMGERMVPARILPPALADDVRVIEIAQVAVFPAARIPTNEVEIGRHPHRV